MWEYTGEDSTAQWIDHGFEVECPHCSFTCNDTWYLGKAVACPNCGAKLDGGNEDG